jgi:hypothetical protein
MSLSAKAVALRFRAQLWSAKASAERFATACAVAVFLAATLAAQSPSGSCEALSGLKPQDTTITTAAAVGGGPFKPNANASAPAMTVPAFCRVAARSAPEISRV